MGLFDGFIVDSSQMPGGYQSNEGYQTKDLFNLVSEARVTNGYLEYRHYELEEVKREDRPCPGEYGILGLMGSWKEKNARWERIDKTGVIRFYDYHNDFDAHFENGFLVKIVDDKGRTKYSRLYKIKELTKKI